MAGLVKREDRDGIYYIQHRCNGKVIRKSTNTRVKQIALQMRRDFETAQVRGEDLFKPTTTPIADVLTKYVTYPMLGRVE